ncbi:MAG TPA: 1-(5-phosphoribosyl)-5-[(5-phosphoribosylamino)methylideneamino]imidazole-4-carboxamide isomerase [Acidimicrobiia bacterium]|jgi:phosphoribosylformimino-5-aminoimidazole carboxamide ribotide isomerase
MEMYPAIDVRGGRAVRLVQGDYARETVYDDDPVSVARRFADAGARWIHVVDLDAARDGGDANLGVIAAICNAVPQCRVQTGGGVRDAAAARARLDAGAARVVIGSAAIERPQLVAELAQQHREGVALGLDVHGRTVRVHGWATDTGLDIADALARVLPPEGVGALVVTQIAVDGLLTGPDVSLYEWLLDATAVPVIASGGVASSDDLMQLATLRTRERTLAGAIVGKAIYEGRVTVEEGIAACSPVG